LLFVKLRRAQEKLKHKLLGKSFCFSFSFGRSPGTFTSKQKQQGDFAMEKTQKKLQFLTDDQFKVGIRRINGKDYFWVTLHEHFVMSKPVNYISKVLENHSKRIEIREGMGLETKKAS